MAHLHAILATASTPAVLIKRGPGEQSCTIAWDRAQDTFTVGQWIKQRLDHTSCDLSPDGRHFVFYVVDHRRGWFGANHVYLAVSEMPWLSARVFWGAAPQTFGPGAGLFFQSPDGTTQLRTVAQEMPRPERNEINLEVVPGLPSSDHEPESLHSRRLVRDGWVRVDTKTSGAASENGQIMGILEKPLPNGCRLRQTHRLAGRVRTLNQGVKWETFALVGPDNEVEPDRNWEWADYDDRRGRLVWTEHSKLWAAQMSTTDIAEAEQLFDANPLRFEGRKAPYASR